MNTAITVTLVARALFHMPLTPIEKKKVTHCVYNQNVPTLNNLQKCVSKHVPDEWILGEDGCLRNRSKVQPYYYMPGQPGRTDGKCAKTYVQMER